MKSEFLLAFNQICSDRGLSREVVLDVLQTALVSAYRRDSDANTPPNVTSQIDLETGQARIFVEKQVVETITDPEQEITLANARVIQPDVEVGDEVMVESTPKNFGRIAAQTAKQVILQRIREAEREAQYTRYVQQEGEIVHGTVQSITPQAVRLHLEGTDAILPRSQQVPGERYTLHQRLRAYVLEVRKTGRGPQVTVSRNHKNMLRRLLELEVPEIFNGTVEIRSISREAGSRSKVAVAARQSGVDPVGACVGMRGVRIQSIVNELGGEKIDIIEWSPDTATFIAKALSPAKVLSVQLEEDPAEGKTASVVVPDGQLSLAIGRAGQNARLAAKLTGWRIDIQSATEAATWALQQVNEDPDVLPALGLVAELLPTVAGILRRYEQERLPYNSEELRTLRQVIEGVGGYYASIRDAERAHLMAEETARRAVIDAAEAERRAAIEAALALIPPQSHEISLTEIDLSTRVFGHLERARLTTVGNVMECLAEGDEGLLKLDGIGPKSLAEIKRCIEALALPEVEEVIATKEEAAAEVEAEAALPPKPAPEVPVTVVEVVAAEAAIDTEAAIEEALEEEVPTPEVALEAVEETPVEEAVAEEVPALAQVQEFSVEEEGETEAELEEGRRRERRLRRQLVYDEELGETVALRRRKRDESLDEWEEYLG